MAEAIWWDTVYLDYCPEPESIRAELAAGVDAVRGIDPDNDSCTACPIGGGMECPGVWRWSSDNRVVTQADLEAQYAPLSPTSKGDQTDEG